MIHDAIYPEAPGHRYVDTSMAAADLIAPHCNRLQRKVLHGFREVGLVGATVDEMCKHLGENRYTVQPRCTELKMMGLLVDSGQRRKNASGATARVLILAEILPAKEGKAND